MNDSRFRRDTEYLSTALTRLFSFITQPNMYARGILFGKMKYELGDHAFLRCPETGLMADLEFKTKGYFGGTYNAIGGFIKDMNTDKNLYELSGLWNGEMFIKNLTVSSRKQCEMQPSILIMWEIDRKERSIVRCLEIKRITPTGTPNRGARRTGIATVMA
jgi:hypothetical protein